MDNDGVVVTAAVVPPPPPPPPPPGLVLSEDDVFIDCNCKKSIITVIKFDMLFLLANLIGYR